MIRVQVHFYAQLKDFFGDAVEIELAGSPTVASLFDTLRQKNALAEDWLRVSRAADDGAFLTEDQALSEGGRYYILPPSSGG